MRSMTLMRDRVHAFFGAESDPLNLAVLRIATFAWLLLMPLRGDFVRFTQIPAELRVAPPGYEAVFHLIPWHATTVRAVHAVVVFACASALVGLAARASALIAGLGLAYLLGLPEFFGKIDHVHHHFIWICALLAASRCGDALSVDAVLAALRRADRDADVEPPRPSAAYALPLRFVWLLIGIAYFFPGLAKLSAGPAWVFSDNLKHLMHRFWTTKDFVPALRIDRYPVVYRAAAAATVLFELGFLPALFLSRLRWLFVAGGLLFHLLTDVYLRIGFYGLLVCYVAFVDWAALLRAIARRVFAAPMLIAYDGRDRTSRRLVAAMRSVDVLRAVEWWDRAARGEPAPLDAAVTLGHSIGIVAVPSGHSSDRRLVWAGIFARLPLALALFPLFAWLATGDIRRGAAAPPRRARPPSLAGIVAVGTVLVGVNILCGAFLVDSWPFAVYPRFAGIADATVTEMEVVVRARDGRTRRVDTGLRPAALMRLMNSHGDDGGARLAALERYLAQRRVALATGESLQVFEITRSTTPEDRGDEPLNRRLLSQLGPVP